MTNKQHLKCENLDMAKKNLKRETESLLIVIYEGLYFDLAQGQMIGAPNETESLLIAA